MGANILTTVIVSEKVYSAASRGPLSAISTKNKICGLMIIILSDDVFLKCFCSLFGDRRLCEDWSLEEDDQSYQVPWLQRSSSCRCCTVLYRFVASNWLLLFAAAAALLHSALSRRGLQKRSCQPREHEGQSEVHCQARSRSQRAR